MSEESPSVYKLPLEVMGLILLKLGNPAERRFDEIKKCRLISSRWYKAVQVVFQDHFYQKCLIHFNGLKYTYGQSRRFGLNIFGSFKLNFGTVMISHSEVYLVNNFLTRLISTNLQNLILKNNQLNLKELLEVLKMFPNIVKLEFIQSDKDMDFAKQMCQLYSNPDGKSDIETIEMIKNQLAGTKNFLRNLKIIDFKIIHASVFNFVILIIGCGQCELEEISIVFNKYGIFFDVFDYPVQENEVNYKNFIIGPMTQLNKFSKSLKKIKITAILNSFMVYEYPFIQVRIARLTESIFNIFNENQLRDLKNIEELKINISKEQFSQNLNVPIYDGILDFIKSQNKMLNVEVGVISESFGSIQSHEFLKSLHLLGVKFGYKASSFGIDPIVQFSENLTSLKVDIQQDSNWRFSDHNVTFPNCKILFLNLSLLWRENNNRWPNFEVPVIVKKFPNLKNFKIEDNAIWIVNERRRPQLLNEDLQIIIKNLPNLEQLFLDNVLDLDDSGLTGLTSEALELRKNSPNLPLTPGERPGLPISHLKNLIDLYIYKDYPTYHNPEAGRNSLNPNPYKITDLTPIYGFECETPKLKCLSIWNSNISASGIDVLKRMLPSSCRLTLDSPKI